MHIYYLMMEAKPCSNNPESHQFGGAYVNCWVKAQNARLALQSAENFLNSEGWEFVNVEEMDLSSRDSYLDEPEFLDCYDSACQNGVGAIFNTWEIEEDVS